MTTLIERQRARSLYLFQQAPFIADKRDAVEAALRAYFEELRDRDALTRDYDDLNEAVSSAMESIDNSSHVHVKDFVLEWLTQ